MVKSYSSVRNTVEPPLIATSLKRPLLSSLQTKKSILRLLLKTSLPQPLSSVSEVAVVERFNCMKIKLQQQLYDWWLSLLKTLIFVSYTRSSKRIYAAIYIPQNFMSFYIHNFGKEKEAYWHRIVTYLNKFKFHHIQFIKVRLCISQ